MEILDPHKLSGNLIFKVDREKTIKEIESLFFSFYNKSVKILGNDVQVKYNRPIYCYENNKLFIARTNKYKIIFADLDLFFDSELVIDHNNNPKYELEDLINLLDSSIRKDIDKMGKHCFSIEQNTKTKIILVKFKFKKYIISIKKKENDVIKESNKTVVSDCSIKDTINKYLDLGTTMNAKDLDDNYENQYSYSSNEINSYVIKLDVEQKEFDYIIRFEDTNYCTNDKNLKFKISERKYFKLVKKDIYSGAIANIKDMSFGEICKKGEISYLIQLLDYKNCDTKKIFFVRTLTGKTLTIPYIHDMKIKELKEVIQEIDGSSPPTQRLIFKGCQMDDDSYLGSYIVPELTIYMVLRLRGGGGSSFVDIGQEFKSYKPSCVGPEWRVYSCGLNLLGFCQNNNCEAYKREVVIGRKFIDFDLIHDLEDPSNKCPICKEHVIPYSFGVSQCKMIIESETESGKKMRIEEIYNNTNFNTPKISAKQSNYKRLTIYISDLDTHTTDFKKIGVGIISNITCPICLDIKQNHIGVTDCKHLFCIDCIETWTRKNSSCPMCRNNINKIYTYKH